MQVWRARAGRKAAYWRALRDWATLVAMLLGLALVVVGLGLAGVGVRVATERGRPLDLAGALLAALGLAASLVGTGQMLSPQFLGRPPGPSLQPAIRLLAIGDGVVAGAFSTSDEGEAGWRLRVGERLRAAGVPVDFVGPDRGGPLAADRDHAGREGATIAQVAARTATILDEHRPDLVALQVGLVDLLAGASPAELEGRLASLLDLVLERAPHAYVMVAGLTAGRLPLETEERLEATNARWLRVVRERGAGEARVRFVDLHARLAGSPVFFGPDGVHPNDRGYARMADGWIDALAVALGTKVHQSPERPASLH